MDRSLDFYSIFKALQNVKLPTHTCATATKRYNMTQNASNHIPCIPSQAGNVGHDTFHPRSRRPQQSAEMQPVAKHHTVSVSQDSLDPNSLTAKSESGMTCLQ